MDLYVHSSSGQKVSGYSNIILAYCWRYHRNEVLRRTSLTRCWCECDSEKGLAPRQKLLNYNIFSLLYFVENPAQEQLTKNRPGAVVTRHVTQ